MDSDARLGLTRLVSALRLTADVTALMIRILDDAEQAAARIDWGGGGVVAATSGDRAVVAPVREDGRRGGGGGAVKNDVISSAPPNPVESIDASTGVVTRAQDGGGSRGFGSDDPDDADTEDAASRRENLIEMIAFMCALLGMFHCAYDPDGPVEDLEYALEDNMMQFFDRLGASWLFEHPDTMYKAARTDFRQDYALLTLEERFLFLMLLANHVHFPFLPDLRDYDPSWLTDPEEHPDDTDVPPQVWTLLRTVVYWMRLVLEDAAQDQDDYARAVIHTAYIAGQFPEEAWDGFGALAGFTGLGIARRLLAPDAGGGSGGGSSRRPRPYGLPAPPVNDVDMDHIIRGHAHRNRQVGSRNTYFPENWSDDDIERAVRQVVSNGDNRVTPRYDPSVASRTGRDGGPLHIYRAEYDGITVEVWYNPRTHQVETAFPPSDAWLSQWN